MFSQERRQPKLARRSQTIDIENATRQQKLTVLAEAPPIIGQMFRCPHVDDSVEAVLAGEVEEVLEDDASRQPGLLQPGTHVLLRLTTQRQARDIKPPLSPVDQECPPSAPHV